MKTRKITVTAVLAAFSSLLMFINFPVPLMPPFIKLDISELPALIASFSLGPVYGMLVCLIKNIVNLLHTQTGGVGELSNFILGTIFVVFAGIIYKKTKTKTGALLGACIGAVIMAAVSIATNYYIVYPFYTNIMPIDTILDLYREINPNVNGLLQALVIFNMPFTFIKGMLSTIITFLIYKRISPLIKGRYLKK